MIAMFGVMITMTVMMEMVIKIIKMTSDGIFETCRCLGRIQSRSEGEDGWQFVDQVSH